MPEVTQESQSSVKVSLNSKGEAQIEVKVYQQPVGEDGVSTDVFNADAKVPLQVERLMTTIHSLERQRIKVVGRDLPEQAPQGDVPAGANTPVGNEATDTKAPAPGRIG